MELTDFLRGLKTPASIGRQIIRGETVNPKSQPQHVVILPYYCQTEVDRYQKMADWMVENCRQPLDCTFLLAASPKATPSGQLLEAYSRIAPTISFQCPTQIFGYPAGPSAMFWDSMDFISQHFSGNGFSLWFESDMAAIKSDWLSRLSNEWFAGEGPPLVMGCYVPHVYKHRWLRKKKLILTPHINGGACYALDFAKRMPIAAREGVFDMSVYQYGRNIGRLKTTQQIAFSTNERARRDLLDPKKCVLHGFMQDKDRFIEQCVAPMTPAEHQSKTWLSIRDAVEYLQRRIRVTFVRRGHRAMLENMLLAKQRLENQS